MICLRYFAAAMDLLLAHLIFCCFSTARASSLTRLPDDEEALKQIGETLRKEWDFSVDPCSGQSGWVTPYLSKEITNSVLCNCSYSDTVCHVTEIVLKSQSLLGSLPPAMAWLPYLEVIDLTRNNLNGTIPVEWAKLPLKKLSLLGNRLSGDIPPWVGNLTDLVELTLEANHFTGQLPVELAKLFNIKKMQLSSNKFSGNLPSSLANLTEIEDFRINDNHFNGKIPVWMENWTKLKTLELQASGFEGPIPTGIFSLTNLTDLMVSDVNGTMIFPQQSNLRNLKRLILRNCGLSGNIPDYIGNLKLKQLDLSFNNLTGTIPTTLQNLKYSAKFMFLNSNNLSGPVQDWMFNSLNIDLSYNNLTWTGHDSSCQQVKLNLVGNSYEVDKLSPTMPCLDLIQCNSCHSLLHINCGGDLFLKNEVAFEEDTDSASASKFFLSANKNWAFSSTGTYQDNNDDDDKYIAEATSSLKLSMPDSPLYSKARISPVSLTYYGLCLVKGNYTVKLHFAEIIITSNEEYSSVGERIFDIYIQGKLVLENFNIRDEANGSGIAIQKIFNVSVMDGKLEIHLHWAGKGTQVIPKRGTYGPLISAISVEPNIRQRHSGKFTKILAAILTSVSFLFFLIVGILWKKGYFGGKTTEGKELKVLDLQTGRFTLKQIKKATNDFSTRNKIGEGGFGPVYKGLLPDGTTVAVKQLSSKSKQGNREFLNEIGMISALQHRNLVKLHGCCIEGNQLLLVYEYMENNSLARALFGSEEHQLKLDWATRIDICVGIAKGLAYIHEESRLKVVHRDIKATNILLDKDLNAKISDFGLARLDEEENSHISTQIAGTIGYMAPEYATRGYLTEKADVYSFGVVVLEVVSGTRVTGYARDGNMPLLDWVQILREEGNLAKLIDPRLHMEFNMEEAIRVINVALLCINTSPSSRPTMSAAVSMLEGQTSAVEVIPEQSLPSNDTEIEESGRSYGSPEYSQTKSFLIERLATASTKSESDLYPVNLDSYHWSQR